MNQEPEPDTMVIAEAVFIRELKRPGDSDASDLDAYLKHGFPNVGGARTNAISDVTSDVSSELIMIYLTPDLERYTLEPDGSVATLYVGRRYDAKTLEPKGPPKRSNDPQDLQRWWMAATGYPSSSAALSTTAGTPAENRREDHG